MYNDVNEIATISLFNGISNEKEKEDEKPKRTREKKNRDTNYSLIQWQTYIQYESVHRRGKISFTFKQMQKDEQNVRKENIMRFY